jgi:hypothetical protein
MKKINGYRALFALLAAAVIYSMLLVCLCANVSDSDMSDCSNYSVCEGGEEEWS